MSIWSTLCGWFDSIYGEEAPCDIGASHCDINPATGLPMVGGCGGVDVEGNPYGADLHHDDTWGTSWESGIGSSWGD